MKFLFVFILLGCFPVTHVSAHTDEKSVVIHMTEQGFDQATVTIPIGGTVTFENTDTIERWPASNDHPSHTLYDGTTLKQHCLATSSKPSFDACRPMEKGEIWSFTFDKAGIYAFHDHGLPHLTGEVRVIDREKKVTSEGLLYRIMRAFRDTWHAFEQVFIGNTDVVHLEKGSDDKEWYVQLKERFAHLVIDSDPREAISTLRKESAHDSRVSAYCHDLLHVIGHTAYDKYGSFSKAVIYQEDFCNSGYIHGLFEKYFTNTKDPLVHLGEQCTSDGVGTRPFDRWQCYHGMGHGFMYFTGGDLDLSLKLCADNLGDKAAAASCQNGVYMEVFNAEIVGKEKSFVNAENPFLTCSTRSTTKESCYIYVPTYISQTLGNDFVNIFSECNRAEKEYRAICISGVGSEAVKRNMNNAKDVFALCAQAGSTSFEKACLVGAVSMYMNQEGSSVAGGQLCQYAPASYRDTCNQIVRSRDSFFK